MLKKYSKSYNVKSKFRMRENLKLEVSLSQKHILTMVKKIMIFNSCESLSVNEKRSKTCSKMEFILSCDIFSSKKSKSACSK